MSMGATEIVLARSQSGEDKRVCVAPASTGGYSGLTTTQTRGAAGSEGPRKASKVLREQAYAE